MHSEIETLNEQMGRSTPLQEATLQTEMDSLHSERLKGLATFRGRLETLEGQLQSESQRQSRLETRLDELVGR